jgi:hypothetical protein
VNAKLAELALLEASNASLRTKTRVLEHAVASREHLVRGRGTGGRGWTVDLGRGVRPGHRGRGWTGVLLGEGGMGQREGRLKRRKRAEHGVASWGHLVRGGAVAVAGEMG